MAGRTKKYEIKKGDRFGKLVVISDEVKVDGKYYYDCQCDCGQLKIAADKYGLIHGKIRSCGCMKSDNSHFERILIEGERLGNFTVLNPGYKKPGKTGFYVKIKCSCGNVEEIVKSNLLNQGYTCCKECRKKAKEEAKAAKSNVETKPEVKNEVKPEVVEVKPHKNFTKLITLRGYIVKDWRVNNAIAELENDGYRIISINRHFDSGKEIVDIISRLR